MHTLTHKHTHTHPQTHWHSDINTYNPYIHTYTFAWTDTQTYIELHTWTKNHRHIYLTCKCVHHREIQHRNTLLYTFPTHRDTETHTIPEELQRQIWTLTHRHTCIFYVIECPWIFSHNTSSSTCPLFKTLCWTFRGLDMLDSLQGFRQSLLLSFLALDMYQEPNRVPDSGECTAARRMEGGTVTILPHGFWEPSCWFHRVCIYTKTYSYTHATPATLTTPRHPWEIIS